MQMLNADPRSTAGWPFSKAEVAPQTSGLEAGVWPMAGMYALKTQDVKSLNQKPVVSATPN